MVDEFGLSDVETAYYLGVQSWLLVVFGMLGAAALWTLWTHTAVRVMWTHTAE